MTNTEEILTLAKRAREFANTLAIQMKEAETRFLDAGDVPAHPCKHWAHEIKWAIDVLENTSVLLAADTTEAGQCYFQETVTDFRHKLEELRYNYYDTHQAHYYQEWRIDQQHFLRDLDTTSPKVLAFDDERSAYQWMMFHDSDGVHDFQHLNPLTVPTHEINPVRTYNLLDAMEHKDFLEYRLKSVRKYFQQIGDTIDQDKLMAIRRLTLKQRRSLLKELRD